MSVLFTRAIAMGALPLAFTSAVSAADPGVKKPAALEYVKICPIYGAGFFVVPGTTSCLKIIGRIRTEYMGLNAVARNGHKDRIRVRGYIGFDHRTATEYGQLRTYVRAFIQHQSGNTSSSGNSSTPSGVNLEYAFIQLGGLTAGRVAPVFEHGWSQFFAPYGYGYHSDISYVNSIGYTVSPGGGFTATVAIDDPSDRLKTGFNGLIAPAGPLNNPASLVMPDIVGTLSHTAGWGDLKLSGALTQVRPAGIAGQGNPSTQYGYAVEGAAKVNLPFLTKGSNLWVTAGYAKGASSYNGFAPYSIGNYTVTPVDYVIPAGTATTRLTTTFATMAALQVYVTPTVAVSIGGSYAAFNPFGANNTVKTATVIGQIAWKPEAGFLIGLEGTYAKLSMGAGTPATIATATSGIRKDDFTGRLRFQRDF